ncbi:hypothetical protein UPYG_G00281140 [Umbra pygmaea]|uniref:RING-type domain-containing protein n=1 Tax=Umbra pygmaea TaxID=75934 RepID=A0ABD0WIU1_UMBPY
MDNALEGTLLRCRRCRKSFGDVTCLHLMSDDNEVAADRCRVWHVNVETLPEWILASVHQAQWTVGKLNCEKCSARLGGFNFLKHSTCPCGLECTVHLSKSRVDQDKRCSIRVVRSLKTRGRGRRCCLKAESGQVSEEDDSEVGNDGSQLCHASVSRLNAQSLPVITHPDAFYRVSDVISTQSAPLSTSRIVSVEEDGEETEEYSHTTAVSYTPHQYAASSPPCPSPLNNERPVMMESEQWQTDSVDSSGESVQLEGLVSAPEVFEEQGWGVPTQPQAQPVAPQRLSKREKNRLKSQRRKQRKKERWLHAQEQCDTGMLTESEEDDKNAYTCAVCLDVYFSPYSCQPCGHIFCEACLRTLARNRPRNTPCPLCRTLISQTVFQKELNQSAKTIYPKKYHSRKHNFQKSNCAKWPLPNCRRQLRLFWGYKSQAAPGMRWPFPTSGFTLDALHLAYVPGWFFDIDMFLYIHSVNWILTLLVICFLTYIFFS